jgi:hypothetical protein
MAKKSTKKQEVEFDAKAVESKLDALLAKPATRGLTMADKLAPFIGKILKANEMGHGADAIAEALSSEEFSISSATVRKVLSQAKAKAAAAKPAAPAAAPVAPVAAPAKK